MPILIRLTISLSLLLAGYSAIAAERVDAKHAQLELLAQQSAASPGQPLWLGVHFLLEKGWHIYWVNPGDSGQPPVFQWQLAPGFSAGDIRWPRPEKMKNSQMADYGYHDETLLLVPVRTPKDFSGNSKVEIGLEAKWLICREVCIADHAHLHLTLPAANSVKEDPNVSQQFARARALVPKPFPQGWSARAESRKESFVLTVTTGTLVRQAEFFPLDPNQVENAAPQTVLPLARGARITLQKSDQLLQPISHLKGILVIAGGTAYTVDAPVVQQRK